MHTQKTREEGPSFNPSSAILGQPLMNGNIGTIPSSDLSLPTVILTRSTHPQPQIGNTLSQIRQTNIVTDARFTEPSLAKISAARVNF